MKRIRRHEAVIVPCAIVVIALASYYPLPFHLSELLESAAAIVAVALLLLPATVTERPARPRIALSALAGIASSMLAVRGWFEGSPAFSHDWKWPLEAVQLSQTPSMLASVWLPWGSGAPAVQALGTYPVTIAGWLLGHIATPHGALLALFAILGAVAGASVAALVARCGLEWPFQVAAALSYAAMPAWFNRECAGHLSWLAGYALFPLLLAVARANISEARRSGAFGIILGIASAQIQFFLFFLVSTLPLLVRRDAWKGVASGSLLALILQAPALLAIYTAAQLGSYTGEHANLTWQLSQSDPMFLALASGADPAHYFAQWLHPVTFVLMLPALFLAGVGAMQNQLTRILGLIWICGALWSSGLDGPMGSVFDWLFLYVPQAIALREFAHAQAVVAAPLLVLAACGTCRLMQRITAPKVLTAATFTLVMVPFVLPAVSGEAANIARPVIADSSRDAVVHAIEALPGEGQVLWWPGLQPVAFGDTRGGVDSDAFPAGSHMPYTEYLPTNALVQTARAVSSGDRASCTLLAHLGIEAIVVRQGLRDAFLDKRTATELQNPNFSGLRQLGTYGPYGLYEVPCYTSQRVQFPYRALYGDWHDVITTARRTNEDFATVPLPAPNGLAAFAPEPTYVTADPSREWVPLLAIPNEFADFSSAFGDVIVTSNPSAPIPGPFVLAAPPNAPYRWMREAQARALLHKGRLAIWLAAKSDEGSNTDTTRILQRIVEAGRYSYPDETARRRLRRSAVTRVVVDGYATGWAGTPLGGGGELHRSGPHGPALLPLWLIVGFGYIICLVLVLLSQRDRVLS